MPGAFVLVALSSWRLGAYVTSVWSNEAAARPYPPQPHFLYGTPTTAPQGRRKASATLARVPVR